MADCAVWAVCSYCGRGLMKRFETAAEVAKEMGIPESKLKQTFDGYMKIAESKNDPFKKKFFCKPLLRSLPRSAADRPPSPPPSQPT